MERVVITGMGVVSPVGNSIEDFWRGISEGKLGIGEITRFDTSGFKVKFAAEVRDFNPLDYMDKNTARRSDLFCQYALAAAAQAVEMSGIEGKVSPERLGVYVGSGIGGMGTFVSEAVKLELGGPRKVSPLFIPKMIGNIAAGNIAIRYQAQGPCLPVVTACATSTNALGEAYRAIQHGYADALIAGGAEATITPLALAGFTNCQALTNADDPGEASIPFDARRSGFVMGEGAGIVVMESLSHAQARGANILGEFAGYGNTCDAHHLTAPDPGAGPSSRAIRMAAEEAGISPSDALYINAHGTGTPLNDSTETMAIKLALGEDAARRAVISSTKSVTGHMLGAAGAAEAIACVLALQHGVIPPTVGYVQPDPKCDLDYTPGKAREYQATLALSSSLGFGGHNGCIAIRPMAPHA